MPVLKELNQQQYLPAEELEAIRISRLAHLFQIAKTHTKYYSQFNSYQELQVLSKDIISQRFTDFVPSSYKKKLIKKTTGGSTGTPFSYYSTNKSLSYLWAGIILSWQVAGYRTGDKVAFLAGSSLYKTGWQHRLFYNLMNIDILHASPLNDSVMKAYAEKIKCRKTTLVYGYAHAINALADYLNRQPATSFPYLKGVVCTAELLTGSARENIEKAFGVKVYNQYGCNEAGVSAFECEQGKMHIISTRCIYETDKDGSLLGTDLSNEGFVMMKYNTTDIVTFSDETCSCKRNFPIIKNVVGRLNDVVVDMKGNVLHASFFGMVFSKDTSIKQFQIVYNNDIIEVNIHSNNPDEETYKNKYLPLLRNHAVFEYYNLKINSPFFVIKNGKHKEVVDNRQSR